MFKMWKFLMAQFFNPSVDTLVSPANSFGFMDGGIDSQLTQELGFHVQSKLQKMISELPEKELLVGRALTIETGHKLWPFLISAPTMRVPMILGTKSVNVYLASLAIFNELKKNQLIKSIAIPGLGIGTGEVPTAVCARQMREAYKTAFEGTVQPTSWEDAKARHQSFYFDI